MDKNFVYLLTKLVKISSDFATGNVNKAEEQYNIGNDLGFEKLDVIRIKHMLSSIIPSLVELKDKNALTDKMFREEIPLFAKVYAVLCYLLTRVMNRNADPKRNTLSITELYFSLLTNGNKLLIPSYLKYTLDDIINLLWNKHFINGEVEFLKANTSSVTLDYYLSNAIEGLEGDSFNHSVTFKPTDFINGNIPNTVPIFTPGHEFSMLVSKYEPTHILKLLDIMVISYLVLTNIRLTSASILDVERNY